MFENNQKYKDENIKNRWASMKNVNMNIIIGCLIIAIGLVAHGYIYRANNVLVDNDIENKLVIDIEEASQYLSFSVNAIKAIIITEETSLEERGSFSGTMIPYFVIDGEYYFEKTSLQRWIADVVKDNRAYNTKKFKMNKHLSVKELKEISD